MKAHTESPQTCFDRSRKQFWPWIGFALLLLPVIGLGILAVGVASMFNTSSDARALQREWARVSGVQGSKQIGVRIGSVTLTAARAGLYFSRLDPEARAALRAVRNVEFNVVEIGSEATGVSGAALLTAADDVLTARGWERVAGILDGDHVVGVYARVDSPSSNSMKGFAVAFDGQHLVSACVQANLTPVLPQLTEMMNGFHGKASRQVARTVGH